MLRLFALPNEVIRRIAEFCGGREIQALICTCAALRALCDEERLFRVSFYNNLPKVSNLWSSREKLLRHVDVEVSQEPPGLSKARWTQLAVAAGMWDDLPAHVDRLLGPYRGLLEEWSTEAPPLDVKTSLAMSHLIGVFSTFAAWGCPVADANALEYLALLARTDQMWPFLSEKKDADTHISLQRAFVLAVGLLWMGENDPASKVNLSRLERKIRHTAYRYRGDGRDLAIVRPPEESYMIRTLLCLSVVLAQRAASRPPEEGSSSSSSSSLFRRPDFRCLPSALVPPPPMSCPPVPLPVMVRAAREARGEALPSGMKALILNGDDLAAADDDHPASSGDAEVDRLRGFGRVPRLVPWYKNRVHELTTSITATADVPDGLNLDDDVDIGEWHGYHTELRRVSKDDDDRLDAEEYDRSSHGSGRVFPFRIINGRLYRESYGDGTPVVVDLPRDRNGTLQVVIVASALRPRLGFNGFVTPLGIAGVLEHGTPLSAAYAIGMFWMWNVDWMR